MEGKGVDFAGIPGTAIKVITSPAVFFREMPKEGGYVEPLVFITAMGLVSGVISAVLILLGLGGAAMLPGMGGGVGAMAAVGALVMTPIMFAIFGFVGAAIIFVIWKLMGSQENYEVAYRCTAYIAAISPITTVLGVIPYAGMAVGILLQVFFLVTASVEVHKLTASKAWLVFGIIGLVLIVFGIVGQLAAKKMSNEMSDFAGQMQQQSEEMQRQAEEAQRMAEEAMRQAQEEQEQYQEGQPQEEQSQE